MKKLLLFGLLCLSDFTIFAQEQSLLSFAVMSDTHFENNAGYGSMTKVAKSLKNLTSLGRLDALAVVGDLTNHGLADEYLLLTQVFCNEQNFVNPVDNLLFMLGNHDMFNPHGKTTYQEGLKDFYGGRLYPLHAYRIIKGYPFITLSQFSSAADDVTNPKNGQLSYPDETLKTLRKYLEKAKKDCPGKPIFVFTHVPPRYTSYGTWPELEGDDGWSMERLNPILNDYPQVVVFCGHSHYPIGDPRSIHQGANPHSERNNYFTVINTGTMTYTEVSPNALDVGKHPWKFDYVAEGLIVHELSNGNFEIMRYDMLRDVEIDIDHRWILKAPFDGSQFEYSDIRDADDNPTEKPLRDGLPAPVFPSGAVVIAEPIANAVKLSIPQATDDACVFRYRVSIIKGGELIVEKFFSSQFYLNSDVPERIVCTINNLDRETEYEVEVTAFDSYDNESHSLTTTFTTTSDSHSLPYEVWTFDDVTHPMKSAKHYTDIIPLVIYSKDSVVKRVETPEEANITYVEGPTEDNKAIRIPVNSALEILLYKENSNKNYTVMMDVRMKDVLSFNSLLQTSAHNNNDADCFIYNSQIGLSVLGYGGNIVSNKWHRIVLVNQNGTFSAYVDGDLIKTATDERWNIDSYGCCLLLDNDEERVITDLAEVAYWDLALTENQIRDLGDINQTTGMKAPLESHIQNSQISLYDLRGSKLNYTDIQSGKLAKGIYILNGKKYIVK